MKKIIRTVLGLLVLSSFVISTNGMSIYHYLCSCKNKTFYTITSGNDCCNNALQEEANNNTCCNHSGGSSKTEIHKHCSTMTCTKEFLFYKVPAVKKNENEQQTFQFFPKTLFSSIIKDLTPLCKYSFSNPDPPPLLNSDIIILQHILII